MWSALLFDGRWQRRNIVNMMPCCGSKFNPVKCVCVRVIYTERERVLKMTVYVGGIPRIGILSEKHASGPIDLLVIFFR